MFKVDRRTIQWHTFDDIGLPVFVLSTSGLITLFAKNARVDLTMTETRQLRRLVTDLEQEG